MARIMYDMSAGAAPSGRRDPEAFERYRAAIIEFVGRYWGQRLGEVQVGKVLLDMLAILRRHRVRVNPTFTIVNIAIAVTEGIGKQLDPELDLMEEALPYFLAPPGRTTPARRPALTYRSLRQRALAAARRSTRNMRLLACPMTRSSG